MARTKHGLNGFSGKIGPVVIKQYADKTVITSRPEKSKKKRSEKQKEGSAEFAKAVAYAQDIINDPIKKNEFLKKLKKGEKLYYAAQAEYRALRKAGLLSQPATVDGVNTVK